jgi:hypothetical protein
MSPRSLDEWLKPPKVFGSFSLPPVQGIAQRLVFFILLPDPFLRRAPVVVAPVEVLLEVCAVRKVIAAVESRRAR